MGFLDLLVKIRTKLWSDYLGSKADMLTKKNLQEILWKKQDNIFVIYHFVQNVQL